MKVKKAIKRLDKVDQLLANVIEQFEVNEAGTRELLDSAKKSVVRAKATLTKQAKSKPRKKPPGAESNVMTSKGSVIDTVRALKKPA